MEYILTVKPKEFAGYTTVTLPRSQRYAVIRDEVLRKAERMAAASRGRG